MSEDPRPTSAEEDYLKTIFGLSEWASAPVTSSDIAAELGVANSSVTIMVRKLVARGWLTHEKYSPVSLTEEGFRVALGVVRRHRLLETFLVRELGYTWEEVHDEADALEHAVSERFVERLDALLGHPREDPHGDRIPGPDGTLAETRAVRASLLDEGHPGVFERVSDQSEAVLRSLAEAGIRPGASVRVTAEGGLIAEDGRAAAGVNEDVWLRSGPHEGCRLPQAPFRHDDGVEPDDAGGR